VGQNFDTPKFYIAQAGHQTFDIKNGFKIAENMVSNVKNELQELKDISDKSVAFDIAMIEKDLKKQEEELKNASDSEATRSIAESCRHIRQAISKITHAPENRMRILSKELTSLEQNFNTLAREFLDEKSIKLFNLNIESAKECLVRGKDKDIKDAECHINILSDILQKGLLENPDFLMGMLKNAMEHSYLATDEKQYSAMLEEGLNAIKSNSIDELRRVLAKLYSLQINVGGAKKSLNNIASIMRLAA
jgi:hypothetical protein